MPLFEALNWAASVELYMREQRKQPLQDDLVHAIGFARNRVHHSWADRLPPPDPKFPDPAGERAYANLVAGQPVRPILRDLQAIFDQHV